MQITLSTSFVISNNFLLILSPTDVILLVKGGENMSQGERVRKVRKYYDLTMEKFGERLGITKTAISLIESGKNNLTDANVKAICREFGIDYIWLTTGEGEMLMDTDIDALAAIDRIMTGENEFHKKLIKWCATAFSDEELQMLEKKINEFVSEFSKKEE